MVKNIKIGSSVRLTDSGIAERKKQYPGFNPSARSGIVTNTAGKGYVVVAISDGELYNLPISALEVTKAPIMGYRHPKAPTMELITKFVEELHGSGINSTWYIDENKTSFRARNTFHTMNDVGMYDSRVDFTVIFPKKQSMENFTLQFTSDSHSQHQVKKYMLREYLNDEITYAVERTWSD